MIRSKTCVVSNPFLKDGKLIVNRLVPLLVSQGPKLLPFIVNLTNDECSPDFNRAGVAEAKNGKREKMIAAMVLLSSILFDRF